MKLKFLATAVALLASLAAEPASAGPDFTGSTVTAILYNPNLATILGGPTVAVVGASTPTFPNGSIIGNTAFQINITGDQIIYNPLTDVTYGSGPFNGFVFDFAGAPTITGVTLDGSSNFVPFDFSFTDNSIDLNLSGNSVNIDSVATLDVAFGTQSVPEPFTLSLFGAGLAGAVAFRRRKKKAA
jgi:hypothetical protein